MNYYPNELEPYHNWYLEKYNKPIMYQSNNYSIDNSDSNLNYRNYRSFINNDGRYNNNNSGINMEYRDSKNAIDQNLNDIIPPCREMFRGR